MSISQSKYIIKELFNDGENAQLVVELSHNNGITTVTQKVIFTKTRGGLWSFSIHLDSDSVFSTPGKATDKLGEWMERLGKAISESETDIILPGM